MKNAVDKRLRGMEVRFDGRTLLIGTVMFAVRAPKPGPELDALAALVRKAVAGPGLRMTVVAVDKAILVPDDLLDPAVAGALVVRTDSYVNTDESMDDVGARVRSALVGAPPRILPWVAHGPATTPSSRARILTRRTRASFGSGSSRPRPTTSRDGRKAS